MQTSEKEGTLNGDSCGTSYKDQEECTASEEYSVLPDTFYSLPVDNVAKRSTLHQKKYEIFKRLQKTTEECSRRFSGRKELACKTNECVSQLCRALEDAFIYGLKTQEQTQLNFVVSAASLFQNMQEIVIGSSSNKSFKKISTSELNFWEFCRIFLTSHEKERFETLKHVRTDWGKSRSFIRAALNEHSLQRYLLTWLSEDQIVRSYYSHWSILLDFEIAKQLPDIVKSLDGVLFALPIDEADLNEPVEIHNVEQCVVREEPLIYAPIPVKVETKVKRKSVAIERPIACINSTDDLLKQLQNLQPECGAATSEKFLTFKEAGSFKDTPANSMELELEFPVKPSVCLTTPKNAEFLRESVSISSGNSYNDLDDDTSSQSSKYSSYDTVSPHTCNDSHHLQLEEQLKDLNERCSLLETRVAQLSLENRQLIRRLKKHFDDSGIDPSSSFATNFLITIPNTKLHKSKHGTGKFYLYEIHITMRQNLEHWSIWRRYSDFYKLHKSLLKTHPSISSVEFPPKKRFGNMNLNFVEERRQQLQIYLLNLVETLSQVEACKSKVELQKMFPFLRER